MSFVIELLNNFEIQTIVKLLLVIILSGFIGLERSSWSKPAGFRTHTLVGISAVLVMVASEYMSSRYDMDASRIPAQLLSGIGFLGAGTILRDGFNVKGLTTASTLLVVTCIGLCIGAGDYLGAIIATVVAYIILSYSHLLSDRLEHYTIVELEILLNKKSDEALALLNDFLIKKEIEITDMDLSLYKEQNKVKIIGKDKGNSEHSLVPELIQLDNIISVKQN